jgi:predicted Zn-dependent protease
VRKKGPHAENQPKGIAFRSNLLTVMAIGIVLGGALQAAEDKAWQKQESRVQAGLKAMYNTEYDKALHLFQEVMQNEPFHPMGPLGYLATRWHINEINLGYEHRNAYFLKDIEQALQIYQAQIDAHPQRPEYVFFYGTVQGLKARVQLGAKDYWGVLLSTYKAIRSIKVAEARCPDLPDYHIASAVFNYYIGISAPYMKIASWILNISGSKAEGLAGIKAAADRGNYSRYEAQGLIAYLYFYFEGDYRQTLHYAQGLMEEFPQNTYYKSLTAEALLGLKQNDKAAAIIKAIKKAVPHLPEKQRREYELRLHLLDGTLALNRGELDRAEQELSYFISHYFFELDYELANAYYRLAQVYELQKRPAEAQSCYQKIISLNNRAFVQRLATAARR